MDAPALSHSLLADAVTMEEYAALKEFGSRHVLYLCWQHPDYLQTWESHHKCTRLVFDTHRLQACSVIVGR